MASAGMFKICFGPICTLPDFWSFYPYTKSETPVWGSLVLCESCTLRVSSSSCCSSCSSQLAGGRDQREEEKQSRGGMMGWASAGCIDTRASNEHSRNLKFINHREGAFTFKNLLRHYAVLSLFIGDGKVG